jgi:hypothetical protein
MLSLRQSFRFLIFACFWMAFAIISYQLFSLLIKNYTDYYIGREVIFFALCLITAIISLLNKCVFTSPILGRTILHDTGRYYLDYRIEKFHYDVKPVISIYKDMILYKKVIHSCTITDVNEETIIQEINRCLITIEKEHNFKKKLTEKKHKVLNLQSLAIQRMNKIKSIL